MLDYTGVKCPVCGAPFQKDDDIVVCPECGAPYHRGCYQQEGHCIFQDLHEQGKEWAPPPPPKAPDAAAEIKDQECPVCGTLNGHSALFCNRCGSSLVGSPQRYNNSPNPQGAPPQPRYTPVAPPFSFDPMGGVSPADILEEGVTFGDASKLVKQNTNYYMPVFHYIRKTRRNKFNFCAFLFSGVWMLYRKQYKYGAVVTALVFGLYIACILLSLFVSAPVLTSFAQQAGLDLNQPLDPSSNAWIAFTELLLADPGAYLRISLPTLCLLAVLIVRIVIGIRGNKLYLQHCVRTVRQVKAGDSVSSAALEEKGGVNLPVAVCLGVCYFLFIFPLLF